MKITHSSSDITRIDRMAVDRVLNTNYVGYGPHARALETFLKKRTAHKSAFALQSGFQALVLALRGLDLPAGSRVGLPALTCGTVAAAVRNAGLIPLLVDIRDDLTLDVTSLPANCAAVIAPH
ncbi:MAG: DegT/DnrJ/EryC1/StrS family aminotransferase, partial [Chthoniobacterales bacterium]